MGISMRTASQEAVVHRSASLHGVWPSATLAEPESSRSSLAEPLALLAVRVLAEPWEPDKEEQRRPAIGRGSRVGRGFGARF